MPVTQGVACPLPRRLGLSGFDDRLQPRQLVLGGGQDDLFLGLVLVVHGRLGHTDLVGDHLQRGPPDTVLGEQVDGCGDDASLRRAGRERHRFAGGSVPLWTHARSLGRRSSTTDTSTSFGELV